MRKQDTLFTPLSSHQLFPHSDCKLAECVACYLFWLTRSGDYIDHNTHIHSVSTPLPVSRKSLLQYPKTHLAYESTRKSLLSSVCLSFFLVQTFLILEISTGPYANYVLILRDQEHFVIVTFLDKYIFLYKISSEVSLLAIACNKKQIYQDIIVLIIICTALTETEV